MRLATLFVILGSTLLGGLDASGAVFEHAPDHIVLRLPSHAWEPAFSFRKTVAFRCARTKDEIEIETHRQASREEGWIVADIRLNQQPLVQEKLAVLNERLRGSAGEPILSINCIPNPLAKNLPPRLQVVVHGTGPSGRQQVAFVDIL